MLIVDNLMPMDIAPRDGSEILAYHKDGKNFHPIQWKDHTWLDGGTKHWGMRWNEEYRQYDCDYSGWVTYPEIDETLK